MKKLFIFVTLLFAGLGLTALPVFASEEPIVTPTVEEVINEEQPVIDPILADETLTEMFLEFVSSAIFWIIATVSALGIPGIIYGVVKVIGAFKSLKGQVSDENLTVSELVTEVRAMRAELKNSTKESTDVKTALTGMIMLMNMDGLKKQRLLEMLSDPTKTAADVTQAIEKEMGSAKSVAKDEVTELLKKLDKRV